MKPFRVLSIDWDYLVNATMEERIMMFPDGGNEDLPTAIQDSIWSTHYNYAGLKHICVDYEALKKLKEFIEIHCRDSRCIIYDSHKFMYDEVISSTEVGQPIRIINVDFHHDMYENDYDEVDCGNWVNCLYENENFRKTHKCDHYWWVAREDSDRHPEYKDYLTEITIDNLKDFEGFDCDLLFICRSSVWSPPHLDGEFKEFCEWCISHTSYGEFNMDNLSRYTDKFKDLIKENDVLKRSVTIELDSSICNQNKGGQK